MSDITQENIEFETTLVICSDNPQKIMSGAKTIESTDDFILIVSGAENIRDRYFDTENSSLGSRKCALRLRQTAEDTLICLKAKGTTTDWGAAIRPELELSWNEENLQRITDAIEKLAVEDVNRSAFSGPEETLPAMGLKSIQDRRCTRHMRNVFKKSSVSRVSLAEVALDEVRYQVPGGHVLHLEVEVEATRHATEKDIASITDQLEKLIGADNTRRWPHNKLITGRALEILAGRGEIKPGAPLRSIDYDRIDELIKKMDLLSRGLF